jgi:hypothetical protein
MSTWKKVLITDANVTVGTINASLTDNTTDLDSSNHGSVELVVVESGELKTRTADFNTGAFTAASGNINNNQVTITAGDGLKTGGSFTVNQSSDSAITLDIDVSDFAGTALKDDGSENLTIDFSGLTALTGGNAVDADLILVDDGANGTLKKMTLSNLADYMEVEITGIANSQLDASAVTIGTTGISLGGQSTTLAGMTGIDFAAANASIAASIGANTLTIGGGSSHVKIAGDLQVVGTTETVNTTELKVEDITIAVASGSTASADANGAGLEVDIDADSNYTANPAILFKDSHTTFSQFEMRKGVSGESNAFIAAMTTAANTTALDALTPGAGTFAMVSNELYIQVS